jgi:hypothetical protein
MSDDRMKADKAWEARQEVARYRIFNAATNAAEATDEADDENYFAVLDQAGTRCADAGSSIRMKSATSVSDIDTVSMGSLKALDPNRPIREADIGVIVGHT